MNVKAGDCKERTQREKPPTLPVRKKSKNESKTEAGRGHITCPL
jgi:hypothetical protein